MADINGTDLLKFHYFFSVLFLWKVTWFIRSGKA